MKYKLIDNEFEIAQFKEGMEDRIVYFIPMFGLFTKEECVEAGFTPNFDNDKIYVINTRDGKKHVNEEYSIVYYGLHKEKHVIHNSDLPLYFEELS